MDLLGLGDHLGSLGEDALEALAVRATPAELDVMVQALEAVTARARSQSDPAAVRAETFAKLGYEPNCKPRIEAARALGYRWPSDAVAARVGLPAPCGQCPQERFHAAGEYDVFYGGAAGGGKTRALLMDSIADALAYAGIVIGVFRESFPELRLSFLRQLGRIGYARSIGAVWNQSAHELRFPNGSILQFAFAVTMDDAGKYLSAEFQKLVIDERTAMAPDVVDALYERVRSSLDHVPVLGVRSASNPGGPGHGPVKSRYIDATDHGEFVVPDEVGRSVRFIPSKATDNPHLDAGYLATLDAIPDPARRAAMRDGSWDVFAGQVFGEWRHDRHTVDPFPLSPAWERLAGVDYGFAAPWCVLWGAVDPDGRVWVYREFYETGVGQTDQARAILAAESDANESLSTRAGDPSMWSKVGEANSMADVYAHEGCQLHKANNNRLDGWARLHHFLADAPACLHHQSQGWETCPRLHVFRTCPNLIRTLPALPYDRHRVEDVDCFVAGTLVSTVEGPKAIEEVRVGDLVNTPIGPQPVVKDGISGLAPTMRVELSDGQSLEGTPDHRVYVQGVGLVSLSRLVVGDILRRENTCTESLSTETFEQWSGRSRHGTTSTTATATRRTTTRRTWRFSPQRTTPVSTSLSATLIPSSGLRCIAGTTPTKGEPSSEPTPPRCEPTLRSEGLRADIVAALLRQDRHDRSSVRQPAPTRTGWLGRRFGRVRSAAKRSGPSTPRPEPVRIVAVGPSGGAKPVHNLTVAVAHLYYANGVLVTNTKAEDHAPDALRYLLLEVGAHGPTVITNPARARIPISGSSAAGVVRSPFGARR